MLRGRRLRKARVVFAMKVNDVVAKVCALVGSDYDVKKIYAFISELDTRAQIDIFGQDPSQINILSVESKDFQLALPTPYDMAYVYYAAARINFEREEFELYNNNYERAQELYGAYARLYNRQGARMKRNFVKGLW